MDDQLNEMVNGPKKQKSRLTELDALAEAKSIVNLSYKALDAEEFMKTYSQPNLEIKKYLQKDCEEKEFRQIIKNFKKETTDLTDYLSKRIDETDDLVSIITDLNTGINTGVTQNLKSYDVQSFEDFLYSVKCRINEKRFRADLIQLEIDDETAFIPNLKLCVDYLEKKKPRELIIIQKNFSLCRTAPC